MTDAADIDATDAALAELRELGLAAARAAQARLLTAEDADEFAQLSLAFGRITRSVRQTLALQDKLKRERDRGAREARAEAAQDRRDRVFRRKAQVESAVERLIWTEAEENETEYLINELAERLEEAALYDDFLAGPVETHIARIANDLGLPLSLPVHGEGGPLAAERAVGGASHDPGASAAPSTMLAHGPPPPKSGEENHRDYWNSA